jgi:hypothetical protein
LIRCALTINGLVASIFFAFFKVFFAIIVPPRLICPAVLHSCSMQRNRQTPLPAATLQKPRFLADANRNLAAAGRRSLVPVEIIIVPLKISTTRRTLGAELRFLPIDIVEAESRKGIKRGTNIQRGHLNSKKGRQPRGDGPLAI